MAPRRFARFTEANIGNRLAIVLDNQVMSAPVIQSRIEDSGVIEGMASQQDASDLALVLRAGSLPAGIVYRRGADGGPVAGRRFHPGGADCGRRRAAGRLFWPCWCTTGRPGINAVLALILNAIILIAALSYFDAVLTLPGIAGCHSHHRYGGRLQRADFRTHSRGAAGRQGESSPRWMRASARRF